MLNTEHLRLWINEQLRIRNWTKADLSRETATSEPMWTRVYQQKTKSLKPDNAKKLCNVFGITEEELYEIAMGKSDPQSSKVKEPPSNYKTKWDRLGEWTAGQPEPIKKAMMAVAESHGWTG